MSGNNNNYILPPKYYVWCGTEALCRLYDKDTKNINGKEPTVPALEGKKYAKEWVEGENKDDPNAFLVLPFNVGGGWSFEEDTQFTLTIRKRTDDPEEENVTIGEDPLG